MNNDITHGESSTCEFAHPYRATITPKHPDQDTQTTATQRLTKSHTVYGQLTPNTPHKALQGNDLESRIVARCPIYKKREKAFPGKPRVGYHPHFVVGVDNHTRSRPSRNPEHIGEIIPRVLAALSRRVKP